MADKLNPKAKETEATVPAFCNPFHQGVSYKQFVEAIPEGTTVREYLTGKDKEPGEPFTEADIAWIEKEVSHFQNK